MERFTNHKRVHVFGLGCARIYIGAIAFYAFGPSPSPIFPNTLFLVVVVIVVAAIVPVVFFILRRKKVPRSKNQTAQMPMRSQKDGDREPKH